MLEKLQDENLQLLIKAILSLETEQDCKNLFDDLLTMSELKEMSQRIKVAQMLREKIPYQIIVEKTSASTATISRVNRAIQYGSDGYNKFFDSLENK